MSSVVGPKVLKKAQIKDNPRISSIGIQGKTNLELVLRKRSICSFIVYATQVPIMIPIRQAANTKIRAS